MRQTRKFILSRDVIFLESSKKDETVERQLDHLDRFTCVKTYHEFDDEIPHLEGGIPILGQSLESPFEAPSSHMKKYFPLHQNLKFIWMM
jgi:hypothetical protein